MIVMASLNQTPNSLKPNIFDWNDPGSYVPPTVEREYLRYRRGTPLEQPKSRLDILKNKWLIVGAAGTGGDCEAFVEWYKKQPAAIPAFADTEGFEVVVLTKSGIYYYDHTCVGFKV